MFIRLDRVGKNGKKFKVYKFRTMHPYSEFLQEYIYKKYSLREGGKFKHDIRVTTIGRFMRRYWLDELPMLLAILPVLYLSAAVMIPLQLKYGSEKSRIVLFILFGVAAALFVGVRNGFGGADPSPDSLVMALSGLSPAAVPLSFTAVCALLTGISYLCSVRIMEKKEF